MAVLDTVLFGGGLAAGSAAMWWMRSRGVTAKPDGPEQIVAAAPVELRTAVLVFADPLQRAYMWTALGLGSLEQGFPPVEDWAYTEHGLRIEVLMLAGQSSKDWACEDTRDAFAAILAVPEVAVSFPDPGVVRIDARTFDTLSAPVTAAPATAGTVDLEAVPVGVTEEHQLWRLRVLYGHILIAGATGSGKGSVVWSILAGIGPAIRSGLVDVLMADPKGGAEFGRGENKLFTRFATDTASILALLREAVETIRERLAVMRAAGVRKHVPTVEHPLVLIVIDEAAALSSYAERDEQQEFRRLTGLLLSQGRAAAVTLIAALQDPSKETMPNRQLFPIRIGLRLDEPTQVAMVHGQGARDRGALCDRISETTPGVGYVGEDGSTGFVRVRAFWVSDDKADALVDTYSPAPQITGPVEDYTGFDPDDLGDGHGDDEPGPVAA